MTGEDREIIEEALEHADNLVLCIIGECYMAEQVREARAAILRAKEVMRRLDTPAM